MQGLIQLFNDYVCSKRIIQSRHGDYYALLAVVSYYFTVSDNVVRRINKLLIEHVIPQIDQTYLTSSI